MEELVAGTFLVCLAILTCSVAILFRVHKTQEVLENVLRELSSPETSKGTIPQEDDADDWKKGNNKGTMWE